MKQTRKYTKSCRFFTEGYIVSRAEVLEQMEQIAAELLGPDKIFYEDGWQEYGEIYCSDEDERRIMTRISEMNPGTRFVFEYDGAVVDDHFREYYFEGTHFGLEGVYLYPNYTEAEWRMLAAQEVEKREYVKRNPLVNLCRSGSDDDYFLEDQRGKMIVNNITFDEWNQIEEVSTEREMVKELYEMGYLVSEKPIISCNDFFDKQFRDVNGVSAGYERLVAWIPKELKEEYVMEHPCICEIGEHMYEKRQ